MRYKTTIEINIDASSTNEALERGQKLCNVINAKDPRNEAWVPKMVVQKETVEDNATIDALHALGEMVKGNIVEDTEYFYRYYIVDGEVYKHRKSEGILLSFAEFLSLDSMELIRDGAEYWEDITEETLK